MKPIPCLLLSCLATILGLLSSATAQTTLFWRSEATNGNWNDSNNWWDGGAPVSPPGSEILRIDNDIQTAMTNDATNTVRHQIWFDVNSTAARTIDGTAANTFVAVSAVDPLIQNDSSADHVINFPVTLGTDGLTVNANTASLTLGGIIDGNGNLLKQGAETLTLSGANTYSGTTTINAGTLSISAEGNLGTAPGAYVADQLTLDGGTLALTGTTFGISTNRGITIGSSGATLDNSAMANNQNGNFNSQITGTGNLTLRANGDTSDGGGGVGGNLTLGNASNDFTGDVTIQSGVVDFTGDGAFGNTANDIIIEGGGLVVTSSRTSPGTRDIVLSGGGNKIFRLYGGRTFTVNGVISGSGNIRHTDGGTLVLNGANTFTGNIDNVRGNLTLANSGHDGIVDMSAGTLVLNAGNTYTGYTHMHGTNTLRLDADNSLPDTTTVLLYGGTTFNVNGKTDSLLSVTTGSAGDTTVTVDLGTGGDLTVTGNSLPAGKTSGYGNATVAGKITGTGDITYNHATDHKGHWDWANASNDFTGTVTVTRGRLRVASADVATDAVLGNADNDLIFNGDIIATFGNQQGTASIQVTNGKDLPLGAGRDIILNSGKEGTMYVWGSTIMTIDGQVTGGGNLRKEDSGVLLLNNTANDWSGETKVISGEIRLGATGALSPTTTPVIAAGTLNLSGNDQTVTGLSGGGNNGGQVNGNATLTVNGSGNYDYTGRVTNGNGGNATVKYAGTGSLTLSGNQDNSGGRAAVDSGELILAKASSGSVHAVGTNNTTGLTINGGTARLDGSGDDQIFTETNVHMTGGILDLNDHNEGFRGLTGTAGTITNTGTGFSNLTVGETSTISDTYSFAGAITDGTGMIDLTKDGAGTLELTGTSTYTGFTIVNGGTLRVHGSLGATSTFVAGILSGNGSIGAAVFLNAGGGLGARISDWTGAAGTGFEDLALQSLTIDAAAHSITIDTTGLVNFTETNATFAFLSTTGGITGFNQPDFTVTAPGFPGAGSWAVQKTANNLELVYTADTSAYGAWAVSKGLTPANNGKSQDPDKDGLDNLGEFGFDGDPLNAASDGKIVGAIADPDGPDPETDALTLTLPVRDGAVFNGPGDLVSDPVDALIYRIQGSDDLIDFTTMAVSEVTPALSAGLPALSTGWSYRTFRTPGTIDEPDPRDFLRASVEEAP